MPVLHAKVDAIPDVPADVLAGKVVPSDWNAAHTVLINLATEVSGTLPPGNMPTYVSSVAAANTSLTISPTTGAVLANLNVANSNTWTAGQTFSVTAPTFSTMTLGSVFFAGTGGIMTHDNAKFFWDNTNKWLGIGTATPSSPVHLFNSAPNKYSFLVAEYTDTTTTTTLDSSMGLALIGPGGSYGNLCGQTDKYNNGVAAGIFSPKQMVLQSFAGAVNGMAIGAWVSDVFMFTGNGGTPAVRWTVKATGTTVFAAGSSSAGTAPFKLTSGALMTAPEVGAVEFLTDKYYGTIGTGTARKEFALNDAALTSGRVPFTTTNGRLIDASTLTYDGVTLTASRSANAPIDMVVNAANGTAAYGRNVVQIAGSQAAYMSATGSSWTASGVFLASQSNFGGSFANGVNIVAEHASGPIRLIAGGTATTNERLQCDANGNVTIGTAALATTATNGFLYIPTCAGTPTGVPTSKTGRAPMIYDTSANKIWFYNGSWRGVLVT